MELIVPLVIGVAAIAMASLVILRLRPSGSSAVVPHEPEAGAPATGPMVVRPSRIVVVGDPRPSTGLRPADGSGRVGPSVDPRRRLLRDASAVLVVLAAVALAASFLSQNAGETGGVLSATGTPNARAGVPLASPDVPVGGSPGSARPTVGPTSASDAGSAAGAPATSRPTSRASQGGPSASRLAVLRPCPGRSGCYLYVVRQGDTLSGLADFFGLRMDTILRLNPQITDSSIIVTGSTLVLPTPTR